MGASAWHDHQRPIQSPSEPSCPAPATGATELERAGTRTHDTKHPERNPTSNRQPPGSRDGALAPPPRRHRRRPRGDPPLVARPRAPRPRGQPHAGRDAGRHRRVRRGYRAAVEYPLHQVDPLALQGELPPLLPSLGLIYTLPASANTPRTRCSSSPSTSSATP